MDGDRAGHFNCDYRQVMLRDLTRAWHARSGGDVSMAKTEEPLSDREQACLLA
jgi:hypothetical protein